MKVCSRTITLRASTGIAALAVVSAASADVTYTLTNATFTGAQFTEAYAAGSLSGTMTGASINMTLISASGQTYANDLAFMVIEPSDVQILQVGGADLMGYPLQKYDWPNGGSSAPGTTCIGTVTFTTAVSMAVPTRSILIGNAYGAGGPGTWSGTITLHGVNAVPAPGAIAILGLVGLSSRRRR